MVVRRLANGVERINSARQRLVKRMVGLSGTVYFPARENRTAETFVRIRVFSILPGKMRTQPPKKPFRLHLRKVGSVVLPKRGSKAPANLLDKVKELHIVRLPN